jgi:hypothetical protein
MLDAGYWMKTRHLSGNEQFTRREVKEYPRLPDGGQAESRISQWQQLFSSQRSEAITRSYATKGCIKNLTVLLSGLTTSNGGVTMSMTNRILLGLGILLVDTVIFFLPLTALFLVYIFVFNPDWFRKFLNKLEK